MHELFHFLMWVVSQIVIRHQASGRKQEQVNE